MPEAVPPGSVATDRATALCKTALCGPGVNPY